MVSCHEGILELKPALGAAGQLVEAGHALENGQVWPGLMEGGGYLEGNGSHSGRGNPRELCSWLVIILLQ